MEDGQLRLVEEATTRVCRECRAEKPLSEFWGNKRYAGACAECISVERSKGYGIPEHLLGLIQMRGSHHVCVPGEVVRDVLGMIGVDSKAGLGRLAGKDETSIRRLFDQEWVSEKKLDEVLTALHCNHLWFDHPGLAECHRAILEFEESRLERVAA